MQINHIVHLMLKGLKERGMYSENLFQRMRQN